jgi:hypothetical protein
MGKLFYDILRDMNSTKFSLTKLAGLLGLIALLATVTMSLMIMWDKKEIDHVLLIEVIGFELTLLGFKNGFGFKKEDGILEEKTQITTTVDILEQKNIIEQNPGEQPLLMKKEKSDNTNDWKKR